MPIASTRLVRAIMVTAEICGTEFSEGAAQTFADDLAGYPERAVMTALDRCRKELTGRLTLAAVIQRLDDGRPGAEEAWGMCPKTEADTAVWTQEMQEAFRVASPLLLTDESIPARMAFLEAYKKMVADARAQKLPARWSVTLGHDVGKRDRVLVEAVQKNRIPADWARSYSPTLMLPGDETPQPNQISSEVRGLLEEAVKPMPIEETNNEEGKSDVQKNA